MKKIIIITVFICTAFSHSEGLWVHTGQMSSGTNIVRALTSNRDGDLFASVWAVGIYKTTDQGMNWTSSGLDGKRVSYLTVAPNGNVYGLSMNQNFSYIHRSSDNGNSWTDVFTGSFPLNYAGGGAIVFPADGSIVAAFAVTVGPTIGDVATFVFKSTDGGNNWFQTQVIGAGFVGGMVITSDNRILLGTSLAGVVQSTNNGNSFFSLNTFPPIYIETILKAPDNTIYVSDAYGLNRSTDNGVTFTDIGSHSSGITLRAAIVNLNGDLFIGLDDRRVFYSDNKGDSWTQINEGLPSDSYFNIFTSVNGKIYGGTGNIGVMVYDNPTSITPQVQIADGFALHQNYPNPFNPVTVIRYSLSENLFTSLKIYDILGNEVTTLVNEKQNAGSYETEFDAGDLTSGTYYYRIVSGNFIETKSMMLVK